MKIVALIEDGQGHLHLLASRSPDLVRREFSSQTGTAHLLWCAVPPEHHGADAIITEAMQRLGAHDTHALAALPSHRIRNVLEDLCLTEPRRQARRRQWRLWCRRIGLRLRHGLRSQSASDQERRLRA
jgi:hypothetical protein